MKTILVTSACVFLVSVIAIRGFAQDISSTGPSPACGSASGTLYVQSGESIVEAWEDGYWDELGRFVMQNSYQTTSSAITYNLVGPIAKVYRVLLRLPNSQIRFYSNFKSIEVHKAEGGILTTTGSISYYRTGTGNIQLNGNMGSLTWEKSSNNATITSTGGGNYQYTVSETTSFSAKSIDAFCYDYATYNSGSGTFSSVTIKVYNPGVITGLSSVVEEDWANLTLTGVEGTIVRWEYSTDNGSTWTNAAGGSSFYRHRIVATTKFRAFVDMGTFGTEYSNVFTVAMTPYTQSYSNSINGANNVREQQVVASGITNPTLVDGLTANQKHEVITFLDGMGRPVQTNVRKSSPLQKDIISASVYDRQGRQATRYLPYVSSLNDGAYKTNAFTEQASFYANGATDKIADSPYPFATTVFEKSPLGLVKEQGSVGQSWQPGSGHTNQINYYSNSANEVRLFKPDGSSTDFYTANELIKIETVDADQKKNQTFTDKAGHTILSRVQLDETINGIVVPWLETYYIYNERGTVKYIISPKGTEALKAGSWSLNLALKDQYVHEFVYDTRGRLIEKKVPGQAWFYYCYDPLDRLVLVQDGYLRPQYKWIYFKYDRKGRIVQQGFYTVTSPSNSSRPAVQSVYLDPFYATTSNPLYEDNAGTNLSFPTTNTESLLINYYDGTGPSASYTPQGLPDEGAPGMKAGLLTYSSRLLLGTSTWLTSYFNYDAYGRVIQVLSNNHLNTTATDLSTLVYDFEGKVTIKKTYHNTGAGKETTIVNRYIYDHAARLKQVYQRNNNDSEVLVVHYNYNGLGQLVEKNLHCKTCVGITLQEAEAQYQSTPSMFLQSVDYRFAINGQLESVNDAQLGGSGPANDDSNDYFGMEFLYNTQESGLNNGAYFNGNISAIKWKGPGGTAGTQGQRSYKYAYDKANRLANSVSQVNDGSSTWTKEVNAFNEGMTYDFNGNIKTLQRNQRKNNGMTVQNKEVSVDFIGETIDDLTYTYNSTLGDQLLKVTDASTTSGFNNGTSNTADDFTYDDSGNVTADKNKGINSVVYNVLGKAQQVNFTDGRKVEYNYDASGTKLTMKTYASANATPRITDYVNGFVYEDNVLSFFPSPEGRVIVNGGVLEYQYAIADHQGNTRVVFSSATPAPQTTATNFESASNTNFQNYPSGGNRSGWDLFNHTTTAPPNTSSQLLNGGNNSQVGVAKSFNVYPGDKIKIDAFAKYYQGNSGSANLAGFATALLNAFQLPAPGGGEVGTPSAGVNSYGSVVAEGNGPGANSHPKAFVNIMLFDKDHKFLDIAYDQIDGGEQVGATPKAAHDYMMSEYTVKEVGYAYVYIANENPTYSEVYFDDVSITYTPSNVIQYNDYYPYGLQASTSWTRDNSSNNFLYNEGSELNKTSGWYETMFRNYDPAIGRFTGIDPLATQYASLSPYHYAGNNPVMLNDPTGAYWGDNNSNSGPQYSNWYQQPISVTSGYQDIFGERGPVGNTNAQNMEQTYQLLNDARSGDMGAVREYAGRNGDLVYSGNGGRVWNPWGGNYNAKKGKYDGVWMSLDDPDAIAFISNKGTGYGLSFGGGRSGGSWDEGLTKDPNKGWLGNERLDGDFCLMEMF